MTGAAVENPIARPRRAPVIDAAIGLVLVAWLLSIVTGRERWPLCNYPMYSHVSASKEQEIFQVWAIVGAEEILLHPDRHLAPFRQPRIRGLFRRLDPSRREDALRVILERYDALRAASFHDGPPIDGLRVYRTTWVIEGGRATLRDRELVVEVRRSAP